MDTRIALAAGIVGGLVAVAGIGGVIAASTGDDPDDVASSVTATSASRDDAEAAAGEAGEAPEAADADAAPDAYDTTTALLFLIEEEKLAHDVYVTLADQWGTKVFSNIAASELTHQDLVAPLLEERDIEDPRASEVGVFTDPALQALYDELVARGTRSLDDAIDVGITIEEKDIADLGAAIAAEDEADVVGVLERLLAGSENHLRSFERLA
ncbi:DUF2202 domain-containing protein [Agromyces sp. ZXT2-6]|uniref:DUF2202 domain-containing protein n=1 Tax=Agromyces sp. ZXT2-6 TaxID=3461153 RepID=UPI004054C86F